MIHTIWHKSSDGFRFLHRLRIAGQNQKLSVFDSFKTSSLYLFRGRCVIRYSLFLSFVPYFSENREKIAEKLGCIFSPSLFWIILRALYLIDTFYLYLIDALALYLMDTLYLYLITPPSIIQNEPTDFKNDNEFFHRQSVSGQNRKLRGQKSPDMGRR